MSATNHFAGGGVRAATRGGSIVPTTRQVESKLGGVNGMTHHRERESTVAACKPSHDRCPRCRNRGFYHDNDERFRTPVWTRCDCAAGQED